MRTRKNTWFLMLLMILLAPSTGWSQKRPRIDSIVMKNGDRFTCEIIRLERGQLHIKTGYTKGTVVIDWQEVARVESPQRFVLESTSGEYSVGVIRNADPDSPVLSVSDAGRTRVVDQDRVVGIEQLEKDAFARFQGNVDYGFSFARANKQTQSNLQGSLRYRTEKYRTEGSISSTFSGQTDGVNTNRHQADASFFRSFGRHWAAGTLANLLNSDQQQLDLRLTLGGGVSRRLIYSNKSELSVLAAAIWNNETFSPEAQRGPTANSAEVQVGTVFSTFRFDSTEFNVAVHFFPSMTDPGRVRLDLSTSMYWDIVGDLYWRFTFYDNFDSRPPAGTARNDFGTTTSIGWKF